MISATLIPVVSNVVENTKFAPIPIPRSNPRSANRSMMSALTSNIVWCMSALTLPKSSVSIADGMKSEMFGDSSTSPNPQCPTNRYVSGPVSPAMVWMPGL